MDEKKIPQRSEIAEEDKWAICDLYATDEDWEKDLEKLNDYTAKVKTFAGHLATAPTPCWSFTTWWRLWRC